MQSGIHAARTIKRRVANNAEPTPFKYRDLGSMAAISRRRAIVSFRGRHFSGWFGWLMWMFVHLTFMTGFRGRFVAAWSWLFSFVGHRRGQRALTITKIGEAPAQTPSHRRPDLDDEESPTEAPTKDLGITVPGTVIHLPARSANPMRMASPSRPEAHHRLLAHDLSPVGRHRCLVSNGAGTVIHHPRRRPTGAHRIDR